VSAQELGHPEGLDPLAAEDRLHELVRGEPLLVLRVLQVLLLEVGPQALHDLAPEMEITKNKNPQASLQICYIGRFFFKSIP
jgi:hypothetical protein